MKKSMSPLRVSRAAWMRLRSVDGPFKDLVMEMITHVVIQYSSLWI